MQRRSLLAALSLGVAALLALPCCSRQEAEQDDAAPARPGLKYYNIDRQGLALEGYSPVSYFVENAAEKGSAQHAVTYKGVTYYMTSPEQVSLFEADPDRYEPQFGGWCAYGCAQSALVAPDPTNFEVVRERLYLFRKTPDMDALERWKAENANGDLLKSARKFWRETTGG